MRKSKEDIVDVTGVRKSDVILQVGRSLPFMRKYVGRSIHIEEADDVPYTDVYDKIFVSGVDLNDAFLGKLVCISVGTIVFLDVGDVVREEIKELFETKWYPANVWDLGSNIGSVLITDAKGPSLKAATNE